MSCVKMRCADCGWVGCPVIILIRGGDGQCGRCGSENLEPVTSAETTKIMGINKNGALDMICRSCGEYTAVCVCVRGIREEDGDE